MHKFKIFMILGLLLLLVAGTNKNTVLAKEINPINVKIGKTICISQSNATYSSSDKSIAYVTKDGTVIGKNKGEVTIKVKTPKKTKSIQLKVIGDKKKKPMAVCVREIGVKIAEFKFGEYNQKTNSIPYTGKVIVKNNGNQKVSKVKCQIKVDKKIFNITVKNISPKESYESKFSGAIKISVDSDEIKLPTISEGATEEEIAVLETEAKEKLIKEKIAKVKKAKAKRVYVKLYTNGMIHSYNYVTKKYKYVYSSPDTTAPKITGFVGKNSYSMDIYLDKELVPLMVVYSKDHKKYDYFKYVKAVDDRDVKCKLTVDTSKVDFKKTGVYVIKYTATDSAGNVSTAKAKLGVRVENYLDRMCDDILADIIKPQMTEQQKARAIFEYSRNNIIYVSHSDKRSWEKAAKNAVDNLKGDCYSYYCLNRALLTRIGIPNIPVNRIDTRYGEHWWGMVYVNGGFYHIDSTPRAKKHFGLVTDAQLKAFCKSIKRPHVFEWEGKPKSAKKVLYSINTKHAK